LIISILNLTNDLCLPTKAFSQIDQNQKSTFRIQIDSGQNILFASNTFFHIKQSRQSKLHIHLINSFDVYFSRYSLNHVHQEDQAQIDISIQYGQNLILEDYAIVTTDVSRSSILKIGFQHSRGTLQMARNAFSKINNGKGKFS
jgi:hypothetical protein